MKSQTRKRGLSGLSLVELLVMLGVIAVLAGILLPAISRPKGQPKAPIIKCVNNLKNVGLAFRIFATDNNDHFPPSVMMSNGVGLTSIELLRIFGYLSNELSTPKLLHCPSDTKRETASDRINFDTMTLKNISYFTSLSADEKFPQVILGGDRNLTTNGVELRTGLFALRTNSQAGWSKRIHNGRGNLVMSDGSVQQASSNRLKEVVMDQGIETNYLVIP
jgi:prepilin-type processing-associated H-X9-DG protein